jgi:predicted ATPase with chaperone activity
MSIEESLDVTRIYSVADQLPPGTPLIKHRPFRAPHHTISHAGLVGGCEDAESVLLQIISGEAGDLGFVIYDEDEGRHGGSIR